jgi:transcriptional regulator with XRE-family HTH domain
MTEFSKLLKECRTKIGLTQYSITKNMNIAKAEYAMYENAMRLPKKEKFEELNQHFNFEQFEIKEVIQDKVLDYIENADIYELFQLEWKLENIMRKN